LFTHHKGRGEEGDQSRPENYETLKEALLELYLSVKIRSDEEIDNYAEEDFMQEKQ